MEINSRLKKIILKDLIVFGRIGETNQSQAIKTIREITKPPISVGRFVMKRARSVNII